MPVLFDVRSASRVYSVAAERHGLSALANSFRAGVVIADRFFAGWFVERGVNAIVLDATEGTKSLSSLDDVIIRIRKDGATRNTHLWAVGGGAIQDVAGFVSSIYMRGIVWTYIPTTLLGMVDSCIGGKSSINVGTYKNLVGTFHSPSSVLIDATLTSTLTVEQRVAGLMEAAKICYCRGEDTFGEYLSLDPVSASTPGDFESIITLSLRSKKWFVETDEYDRAERLLLNLGHTFGHALESASDFRLSHGVGVGVGILCAMELAGDLCGGPPRGAAPLLAEHVRSLLAHLPELPRVLQAIKISSALESLNSDKKHEADNYRFVTFDELGTVKLVRLSKNSEIRERLAGALCRTMELLSA